MLAILACYLLLWAPYFFNHQYLDTPFGIVAVFPILSIYIFHGIGIPGVLQNDGACGWGWCAPTPFGWVFLVIFWLLVVWAVARIIVRLGSPKGVCPGSENSGC
jgi:hypothetical protein